MEARYPLIEALESYILGKISLFDLRDWVNQNSLDLNELKVSPGLLLKIKRGNISAIFSILGEASQDQRWRSIFKTGEFEGQNEFLACDREIQNALESKDLIRYAEPPWVKTCKT